MSNGPTRCDFYTVYRKARPEKGASLVHEGTLPRVNFQSLPVSYPPTQLTG